MLLMAFVAAFVSGCSSDEPDADGPTVTATAHEDSRGTPTDAPIETPTDQASSSAPGQPDPVAAVCAPYTAMVTAIKEAASSSTDPDDIAA